jgi:hypothetical protein
MRGGAIRPLSNLLGESSLGAMMGSRSGRFPEAWARRFCITVLVTVIRLTGCLEGKVTQSVLYRWMGLEDVDVDVPGTGAWWWRVDAI